MSSAFRSEEQGTILASREWLIGADHVVKLHLVDCSSPILMFADRRVLKLDIVQGRLVWASE